MSVKISFENGSTTYRLEHWFVGEGVAVNSGQDLAMIRADDILNVVISPINGIFLAKRVLEGETFEPGSTIGLVVSHEEAGGIRVTDKLSIHDRRILDSLHTKNTQASGIAQPVHVKATPSARREARKRHLNLREIRGTGPDGRIHLQDVIDYNVSKDKEVKVKNELEAVYNLPLTPLAELLVKKYGLDASLIPAPPGAKKLKKADVERYLKNPETAHIFEEEQNTLYDELKAYEPESVQTVETEITEPEPEITEIEPETVEVEEPQISEPETTETEEIPVYTYRTKETPVYESNTLQLEGGERHELIEEGAPIPQEAIRLSTVVPAAQPSYETIELGTDEVKDEVIKDVKTEVSKTSSAHVSTFTIVDLKKIGVEKKRSDQSILDYTRAVLLKTIVTALEKEDQNELLYLPDIGDERVLAVKTEKDKLTSEPTKIESGDFIIVDLISSNVSSASGLIETDKPVLYFSYMCQVSDLLGGTFASRSIISISLDFNPKTLEATEALRLLESVKTSLGEIDEVSR